jgi:peptidoglycan/LPS O-acetylase OafA/YrhL
VHHPQRKYFARVHKENSATMAMDQAGNQSDESNVSSFTWRVGSAFDLSFLKIPGLFHHPDLFASDALNTRLTHLGHIDGLRAIAVLGVVLTHFKANWLPGGFLGVDVFFVISGYLISKTLYQNVSTDTFSLVEFYEKRARRIVPALVAVTAISSVAAYFILLPQELVDFAKSVFASSLFATNILFYATSDYFAPAANQIPLLHYWSLAVEEQFYVLFPLLVIATRNWQRRSFFIVLLALSIVSLVSAQWMIGRDPSAAFYLLPFRFFELAIGCLLALPGLRAPSNSLLGGTCVSAGVALIIGGMLVVTEKWSFPGVVALIPCIGTALVIWGAHSIYSVPSRMLGTAPFKFVGTISYSLYLVHWPVVVFGLRLFPYLDPATFLVAGILVSILLGYLSYLLVETPTRKKKVIYSRKAILAFSGFALTGFLGGSIVVIQAHGFSGRVNERVATMMGYLKYDYKSEFREGTCFLRPEQLPEALDKAACVPEKAPAILLWGDSYIAQFYFGLVDQINAQGYSLGQLTASACAPTPGVDMPLRPNCLGFNDYALKTIVNAKPRLVVLGANWSATDEQLSALDRTIAQLNEAGIAVAMFGPSPVYIRSVPSIVAERVAQGNPSTLSGADLASQYVYGADDRMKAHFGGRADVKYISVLDSACRERECPLTVNGIPAHFDVAHLTREGAQYYGEKLFPELFSTKVLTKATN